MLADHTGGGAAVDLTTSWVELRAGLLRTRGLLAERRTRLADARVRAAIIWAPPEGLLQFSYIVPIIFLFIAIGAFLLLLLHYAYSLQELKPAMPVSALGLPDGSIRAFITIALIVLVAVFGTFIYFESGKPPGYALVRSDVPVTKPDQLEELKKSVGTEYREVPIPWWLSFEEIAAAKVEYRVKEEGETATA